MINQDPRSTQGIMARGSNVYSGGSANSYGGKVTANSMRPKEAAGLPTYKKLSLQDVAKRALGGDLRSN